MGLKRTFPCLDVQAAGRSQCSRLSGAAGLVLAGCASGEHTLTRRTAPPPRLSSLGVERQASLVSYCWSVPRSNGSHGLRWKPEVPIVLDLVLPAHDVQVRVANNSRQSDGLRGVDLHQGSLGRRWTFDLTRATTLPPASKSPPGWPPMRLMSGGGRPRATRSGVGCAATASPMCRLSCPTRRSTSLILTRG